MNRGQTTGTAKPAIPLAEPTVALDVATRGRRRFVQLRCRRRRASGALLFPLILIATSGAARADDVESARPAPARTPPPVVVIAPPPPEPGPPAPAAPPREREELDERPAVTHRFEIAFAGTTTPMSLGNVRFAGSGVAPGTGQRTSFVHTGREVGLRRPTFWGGELAIGYRHTYFGVFALGTIAKLGEQDAAPTNVHAAAQLGASDVTAYGGGIEAFGAVPLGPLTLSLGAAAGLRGFSAPLVGFEPTTCTRSTRRGRYRYPCAETAVTGAVPWVQPRLRFDVALDTQRVVFLGGFVGMDALGDGSRLGGVVFGFRL